MSHNWWHKDDGMTSKEAVARTQANVREEARRPSTWSPPPKPEPPGPQFGGGGAGLPAGTFISPTSVGGGSTLPGGGFNIGHGEGQIDPGLAAAAGIGPAASGFSGTTVGQGEGITGIIGDDDTTGGGIVQAVIDQGTKVKETVSDLYKNYIQGKPIRTLTPKEIEMLMMGLGRYDPVEGFQASGASAYGALLNAIFVRIWRKRYLMHGKNWTRQQEAKAAEAARELWALFQHHSPTLIIMEFWTVWKWRKQRRHQRQQYQRQQYQRRQ